MKEFDPDFGNSSVTVHKKSQTSFPKRVVVRPQTINNGAMRYSHLPQHQMCLSVENQQVEELRESDLSSSMKIPESFKVRRVT